MASFFIELCHCHCQFLNPKQRNSITVACMNAGLIIPSPPAQIAPMDNTEVFCGSYLNPLNGQATAGLVTGQ
jgi:hypothetical protein